MLTLDTLLRIPACVASSVVGEDAFLLNTQSNKYYGLEKVGARAWQLLNAGQQLREIQQTLLAEYEVAPAQLEQDLLELVNYLLEKDLVEIVHE